MGRKYSPLGIRHNLRSERGDTIVEVMISLIIVASIIVGAFVLARTNTRNIQNSEEHSRALQLLQGQVELLRAYAVSPAAAAHPLPTSSGVTYCMKTDGSDWITSGAPNCNNIDSYFDLVVRQSSAPVGVFGPTYSFTVTWPAQDGSVSKVSLIYRLASV